MSIHDTIIALALLKTNWELSQKSYIDNFNLLTAECLRRSAEDIVSSHAIQAALRETFGLILPLNTVETLLTRAAKQGFVSRNHGVYRINRSAVSDLNFQSIQRQALAAQESMLQNIVTYAMGHFSLTWTQEDAERAVYSYLAEETTTLLRAAADRSNVPLPKRRSKSDRYVLASYVNWLDKDSAAFDSLRMVVEGNMLVTGMFLSDNTKAKFSGTSVFFDTKFLLGALGHAGPSLGAPHIELLELLRRFGAKTCCFSHTFDEVRSVLLGCARNLRVGAEFPGYGPVFDHFFARNYSESDVLLLASGLETGLDNLGIDIRGTPDYKKDYPIDEKKLEEVISARVRYLNQNALIRDISSVAGVVRLRGESRPRLLETSGALFVTSNRPLVRAVSEFIEMDMPDVDVPVAVTDGDLTNLLWLKQPSVASDLPRRRLIATCYAALQPSDEFRRRYLQEVDRLAKSGAYSERDMYFLRHSLEARKRAMEMTLGDEEAFTQGTVAELLEVMQLEIKKEALAQIDEQKLLAETASRQANALEEALSLEYKRREDQRESRHQRADALASSIAWLIAFITSVSAAILIYVSFSDFPLADQVPKKARLWATLAVAVITLLSWIMPVSILNLRKRLQNLLRGRIVRVLSWAAGE